MPGTNLFSVISVNPSKRSGFAKTQNLISKAACSPSGREMHPSVLEMRWWSCEMSCRMEVWSVKQSDWWTRSRPQGYPWFPSKQPVFPSAMIIWTCIAVQSTIMPQLHVKSAVLHQLWATITLRFTCSFALVSSTAYSCELVPCRLTLHLKVECVISVLFPNIQTATSTLPWFYPITQTGRLTPNSLRIW